MEIAYLKSGFVRVVQNGECFEVQTMRFRGESKHADGSPFWKKLYGIYDRAKAIRVMESYG
jgi:hypothetical protein